MGIRVLPGVPEIPCAARDLERGFRMVVSRWAMFGRGFRWWRVVSVDLEQVVDGADEPPFT